MEYKLIIEKNTQTISSCDVTRNKEINLFIFSDQQASLLHYFSEDIAKRGGPQVSGVRMIVVQAGVELKQTFSESQQEVVRVYSDGLMSALIFEGMKKVDNDILPNKLPSLSSLENQYSILYLAARNQILLELVEHRAFAYHIENSGKIVRLVAHLKGKGLQDIDSENSKVELSSHSGLSLGPHTEGPYWSTVKAKNGHSPSPSSLILSSMWNPLMEPTLVIPMLEVLERVGITNVLALSSYSFNFTYSDSYADGEGEDGKGVSIIDFNEKFFFSIRYNSYRFSVDEKSSNIVKRAYEIFCQAVNDAVPYQCVLTQESAIVINNYRALHCRDVVKDNRRLLVRLFGLAKYAEGIVISDDPLLLKG
ncbi:hypothetical protein QPK14_11785 [Photorhabdus temperata subsp. temperata]|uniref:TauD/TfdA-like domain-containing protein n=1 Tax=Photorhabdus temperata subsp. temperata Meg1 TaxID=1393735 RepID=A0A081S0B1_PHOTE|nr:hypothetical protein [Photorhabdus temperata]KER04364.1 hypothetical protein MEG1DRAFT_00909 [Photorhabdus temperata subsp. temperata Meg1]